MTKPNNLDLELEQDVAPDTKEEPKITYNPVKNKTQRDITWHFVYAALFFTLLFTGLISFFVDDPSRLSALADVITYFYFLAGTVIAAYMGYETFTGWKK